MELVAKIVKEEFDILKAELISEYNGLGMKASGQFERELESVATKDGARLIGINYSEQLEFGRQRGKFPPRDAIEQWIVDKGIASRIEGEISVKSLAFLIARKIAREGWDRRNFGGVELISRVITPEKIQRIIDKVGDAVTVDFTSRFIKELQTI
jgi:hypothetical protein